jgi:hypothetical protein
MDQRRGGVVEQVRIVDPEDERAATRALGQGVAGHAQQVLARLDAGQRVRQQVRERAEGDLARGVGANRPGRRPAATGRSLQHLGGEPRLADARGAREHDTRRLVAIERGLDERELLAPSRKWPHPEHRIHPRSAY